LNKFEQKSTLPSSEQALPGRAESMPVPEQHFVNGHSLAGPFDENLQQAVFALGCFWGAERIFWETPGVYSTAVRIVFDPERVSYAELLRVFWEAHDPTQGMRQGNDVGTQYRSAIYTFNDSQHVAAQRSRVAYETELKSAGYGPITTEILPLDTFYFAEDYHQQYLAKNPGGYCGIGGTGVSCPAGLALAGLALDAQAT
jgi:peptide-methionine (S)-S-oxide reductase